ncbi:LacI family DNA-binding transcriptional regulator [Microbulbifer sp. S227A]|uniref:LacI family DNA-binding transcriptional regulator n=1 Tax=Microbulbifer sp. S227A TaxID=3415131 RepID=UPI003C7DAA7F
MAKKFGSIRDVARATGLSTATISRVMNGARNVSPETRDRVLEACRRMDYVPNPAARALSTNKSRTIAAIIPNIDNSVFSKYIAGIEEALDKRNYSLVLAVCHGDPEQEFLAARKLLGMGAEAFILSGAVHLQELTQTLTRRQVPYVFTSIWDAESPTPTIGYDNFGIARNSVRYLADRGHRRLGVIHGPLAESDRTAARRAGALSAADDSLSLDCVETDLSVEGGKRAMVDILSRDPGVTAVLCMSDVLALGVYFGLFEAGLRVPDDVSVMGFDNLDWAKDAAPPLTTNDLPAGSMGREVANQFVDHLEDGAALESRLLPSRIVERASVRAL